MAAAAAGLAAASLAGCSWDEAKFRQSATVEAPHVTGSGVRVETHNGEVLVRRAGEAGGDGEVSITANLRMRTQERLEQVTVVANRDGEGVLEIKALPPEGGWKSSEGCGFEVLVPEAGPVEVTTGNGRVGVEGMSGLAKLKSSNGRIKVLDHDGEVRASTSNGRIEVEGATGAVEARTSNGRVSVSLADSAIGPVVIRTSNGAVSFEYGPAFAGVLDISTSNGSLSLPESGDVKIVKRGRRSATIEVGGMGPESEIRTSNGSVTVKGRE